MIHTKNDLHITHIIHMLNKMNDIHKPYNFIKINMYHVY